ncbi:MAG TPA: hypothetical protein DCP92_11730 [Nitrospiraceae bacterium]|nr:hypothetical protein [Nitrospiraceae bacterium]
MLINILLHEPYGAQCGANKNFPVEKWEGLPATSTITTAGRLMSLPLLRCLLHLWALLLPDERQVMKILGSGIKI